MSERSFRYLVALAFTASGFSALAYQVAWQRVLTQVIGSDATSVVLIVSIFMICLGIGAEIGRRLLTVLSLPTARLYATIEIMVGLYGIVSIPILRSVNAWWASFGPSSILADSLLNLALLAGPVVGMGVTTPLIVHLARERLENLGRTVGTLYGLNILGAAVGAAVTGLVLIEFVGLSGTTVIAAAINIAVGLILLLVLWGRDGRPTTREAAPAIGGTSASIAALAFGFGTLAIQIALFRVLSNYFTMTPLVFPLMLAAFLLLMSAGQWLGGRLADRVPGSPGVLIAALFAAGSVLVLAATRFPPEAAAWIGALRFTTFNGSLLASEWRHLIGDPNPVTVFIFSCSILSSVVAWSALFPVLLRYVTPSIEHAGRSFARLYSLYTIGNVFGAFVFGLLLLPVAGTGLSLVVAIAIVAVGALVLFPQGAPVRITLGALAAAVLIPTNYYDSFKLGDYKITDVYEGRSGVVTTVETPHFYMIVDMNRTASASAMVREGFSR